MFLHPRLTDQSSSRHAKRGLASSVFAALTSAEGVLSRHYSPRFYPPQPLKFARSLRGLSASEVVLPELSNTFIFLLLQSIAYSGRYGFAALSQPLWQLPTVSAIGMRRAGMHLSGLECQVPTRLSKAVLALYASECQKHLTSAGSS